MGDYSAILGKELAKLGLEVHYAGLPQIAPVNIEPYNELNKGNIIEQIVTKNQIEIIYLSYVNYGYQNKGVPFWLYYSLKRIKNISLYTFFHELNATSYKPWRSAFWLKPLQIYIYKKIARISDAIYCSNDIVFNILNKNFGNKLIKTGIFANIPEPTAPLKAFSERNNTAVVFGSYGRRKLVYQEFDKLNRFIQHHNIKTIIDIGNGNIGTLTKNINIPVVPKGILPNREIAKLFENLKYGFISYPSTMFGKSGIFAAYAAYALVILNFDSSQENKMEGLAEGKDYLNIAPLEENLDYVSISKNIKSWYDKRSLSMHINHVYKKMANS